MNNETKDALKTIIGVSRKYASELNKKKRKTQNQIFELAVIYRDVITLEKLLKN